MARREKSFIQDKLSEVLHVSPDKAREQERMIEFERGRYEEAEEGRLHLQAQIDLIQEYIDHEEQQLEKCKKRLDPDQQARFEETKLRSPQ